ncbi:hypothetical protein F5B20DRAFT_536703 [Whalleya microplaca]|nr:hypothetical protein F5B20DRAFT_536703 [Whalleya microplaca]
MDDLDLNISNGTCYYNVNAKADDQYIPCGNAAGPGYDVQCCIAGDVCLSSNACFHAKYTITYLAGCTDSGYGSPRCPLKSAQFADQQWVGLGRCDPDDNFWAGCKETEDVPGLQALPECKCTPNTTLFEDKPKLDNIASLPQSSGGTVSWYPGHEPTASPVLTTSSSTSQTNPASISSAVSGSGASPSTNGGSQVAVTNASTPPANPSEGLSTGAQAGIGLGGGIGLLVIGGLIYLAFVLRRRSKKEAKDARSSLPIHDTPSSPAFSGFKSELPADEKSELPTTESQKAELPANATIPPQRQYKAYNPRVHGDGGESINSHNPTELPLSQRTGIQERGQQGEGGRRSETSSTGLIHELEG